MYSSEAQLIRDPAAFAEHRLQFHLDPWQAEVLRATESKLILNCARQTGKSSVAGILALLTALSEENGLVILISRSLRQSIELALKVRGFLDTFRSTITAALPKVYVELEEDNKTTFKLFNGSRVVSLPENPDTIRGFSKVSLICVDEASRVPDDTYYTLRPMLAVSQGRLILLSTPYGRRGFFYGEWGNPGFRRWLVPAHECPRISPEFLASERREIGEWWYRQEYQCEFVDLTSNMFNIERVVSNIRRDLAPLDVEELISGR